MAHFGRNSFPRRFGGRPREYEEEHIALLDALADVYSTTEGTELWCEMYAMAGAIGIVWSLARRQANQGIPERMMEALESWERACRLRPAPTARVQERRKAVAAKLRGLAGNTMTDITDACAAIGGQNFVQIRTVPTASQVNYWPGIYPGPPGYEFASNRLVICAEMTRAGLSGRAYTELQNRTQAMLFGMLPSYMTAVVGTNDGGFICDVGVVGETLL
jgi:hypothetical protein